MNAPTEAQHFDAAQLCQSQALAIADIHPSPTNPRKTFPEDAHVEMVKSVKRHGVMTPILVRPWPESYPFEGDKPKYELIAGERRYRAAKGAELPFVPGLVRDLTDEETMELQIIENLHRKDLNELEEAEGYELAMKRFKYTVDQLAEKIEKSKAYIYARLKLTALCEKAREAFRAGTLDASRALLIARIPLATLQARATEDITEGWAGPMTHRAAAEHVQRTYMLKLANVTFPTSDESLVAGAGQCQACPKRTGNNPELYADVKSADICTDPECFAAKKAAWMERQKAEAEAAGRTVIMGDEARKIMPYGADSDMQHYVALDRPNYHAPKIDGATPTTRQMLADSKIETLMVEDSRSGKLVEVAKRSEIKKAMQAAGIDAPTSASERDKEEEARAREEGEFRRRLHRQVRAAFLSDVNEHDPVLDEDDMRLIAQQFWSCTWQENQKRLAAIWVESDEKLNDYERIHQLTKRIATMSPSELCLLLIDLSLIGQTHVNTYSRESTAPHLLAMANRLGVSADTIRREMQVEKEAKAAKKKGKGAAAKAPPFAIGDHAEVVAYSCNTEWVGSIGQITGEGKSIATGKSIYTLTLADGHSLNAEEHELGTSTADAFEAQQAERNPGADEQEEAPAVVRHKHAAAIAYRHPEEPSLEWTGCGRKPKWVEFWIEKGGTLEELAVAQRCDKTLELPGVTTPQSYPAIGTAMEGGFFGGVINVNGTYKGVIWAPKQEGELDSILMPAGKTMSGADSTFDCLGNTQALKAADSPTAKAVSALTINGFNDWLIPSRDVLELGYRHFKPATYGNYCSQRNGENLNSIPPGDGYGKNAPEQTPLSAFQEGGAEAFDTDWYMSSSVMPSGGTAFVQDFSDGGQHGCTLSSECRVRAVRLIQL